VIYHRHRSHWRYSTNRGDLDDLKTTVDETVKMLRSKRRSKPFDSIVVTGLSGLLVGAPTALRLKVPLVVIRKAKENFHGGSVAVNRNKIGSRWLFLDDFSSTGATEKRVQKVVYDYISGTTKQIGSFFYRLDVPEKDGWQEPFGKGFN
jgi:orotate phosphoribosyltransferase